MYNTKSESTKYATVETLVYNTKSESTKYATVEKARRNMTGLDSKKDRRARYFHAHIFLSVEALRARPFRLGVRTALFHGVDTGSIPVRDKARLAWPPGLAWPGRLACLPACLKINFPPAPEGAPYHLEKR